MNTINSKANQPNFGWNLPLGKTADKSKRAITFVYGLTRDARKIPDSKSLVFLPGVVKSPENHVISADLISTMFTKFKSGISSLKAKTAIVDWFSDLRNTKIEVSEGVSVGSGSKVGDIVAGYNVNIDPKVKAGNINAKKLIMIGKNAETGNNCSQRIFIGEGSKTGDNYVQDGYLTVGKNAVTENNTGAGTSNIYLESGSSSLDNKTDGRIFYEKGYKAESLKAKLGIQDRASVLR